MKPRTTLYFLQESFVGMRRNGWASIASIGAVAAALLVLGVFLLLAVNLDYMATSVESQVEISAFVGDDLSAVGGIQALSDKIKQLPGVKEVRFVSREMALRELKEKWGDRSDLLAGFDNKNNPLRHSFRIKATEPAAVEPLARDVAQIPGIASVKYGKDVVDKLFRFTSLSRVIGLALMLVIGLVAVFIIANTIKLAVFARRREIQIMKYVGATDWFIRWPFIVEGLILGLIGALIAVGILSGGYVYLVDYIALHFPILPLLSPWPLLLRFAALLLTAGMVLGAIGSGLSVRKFLKV